MIFYIFALVMGMAGAARESAKVIKSPPYITNSLVNLGKMDISFYFNTKDQGGFPGIPPVTDILKKMDLSTIPQNANIMFQKPITPLEEPCPCSMLRNYKDTNPSAILNKILSSNDLFSYKNPMSSVLCCESHEEVAPHEETVILDLDTKPNLAAVEPSMSLPPFPFMLESLFNKEMPFAPQMSANNSKPKTIEILFFPKKSLEKIPSKSRYTPVVKKESTPQKRVEKQFNVAKKSDVSVKKDLKKEILETTTIETKENEENFTKYSNHL